jgi:hypothetical protein
MTMEATKQQTINRQQMPSRPPHCRNVALSIESKSLADIIVTGKDNNRHEGLTPYTMAETVKSPGRIPGT